MYNIVLMDDHQVILESLANMLATSERFRVLGMAQDKKSLMLALEHAWLDDQPADVLITDLLMPSLNGIDLIPIVKKQYPELAILALSGTEDAAVVWQAMQAGADGYVTKTADKSELFGAIQAVASGRRYVDSRVFLMNDEPDPSTGLSPLTDRETEIATLILDELSSTQIAERLFISFNTVETHRKRIYQKLGVTTSLGLMKYSLRRGLMRH